MEDKKKVSGPKALEVIDLVDDDSDGSSHDDRSWTQPSMAKRSRHENETSTRPDGKGSSIHHQQASSNDISTTQQCPIKLFATYQDEQIRHGKDRSHWSNLHCWTLRELLGLDHNPNDILLHENRERIDFMIISNFMMDIDYLTQEEAPELLSIPTTLVFYNHLCGDRGGDPQGSMNLWKQRSTGQVHFIRRDPNERSEAIATPIPFGCHHTKLFLVGYSSPSARRRLRVIVHTCNLLSNDIHLKCQGAYVQDFFWKENLFSSSPFETALTDYLATYRYLRKHKWHPSNDKEPEEPSFLLDQIGNYDFSTAKAVLIPSVPGFHKPSNSSKEDGMAKWGYLAVKRAIQTHVTLPPSSSSVRGRSIVCQFSSIGSLSEAYLHSLWNAWDVNRVLQGTKSTSGRFLHSPEQPYQFELVYPTYDEIVASVEGVLGGCSVPGSTRNVSKPFLRTLWHRWTSSPPVTSSAGTCMHMIEEKGKHVPHIKTYYQVDEENKGMHWFMIGSHNLSKAAWGEQQNGMRGPCYKIFHWELGVFVSAQTLGVDRLVPLGYDINNHNGKGLGHERSSVCEIPLPYAFRPNRHGLNDRAWTTDMMIG